MPKRIKSRTERRARQLRRAYKLMRQRFGHQQWWPGETPFEVCVGAILTQNTSWTNVERAIANLKSAGVLDAKRMFVLPETELAQLIRPAGYFNLKARRLRSFLRVLVEEYGGELHLLFSGQTQTVRARLLDINGIGPETADSLLLYAGGHHSFVVDAYTKRIFSRHRWCSADADYDSLKHLCESAVTEKPVSERLDHWQDYHAQLVMVGKHYCRKSELRCPECPLHSLMPQQTLTPNSFSSRQEVTAASPVRNLGVLHYLCMTCRHFRYEVPREYADELRDADPQPCPVCDALPHRKAMAAKKAAATTLVEYVNPSPVGASSWLARLLGKREEILPAMPTPARFSA